MRYNLNEKVSDSLVAYIFINRLLKPWSEWDAYKFGIIDGKGKKKKNPVSYEELSAWTVLDRFVWNLKKLLDKFVKKDVLPSVLSTTYLLRNSISPIIKVGLERGWYDSELASMTFNKQLNLYEMFEDMKGMQLDESVSFMEERDFIHQLDKYLMKYHPLIRDTAGYKVLIDDFMEPGYIEEDAPPVVVATPNVASDIEGCPSVLGQPLRRPRKKRKTKVKEMIPDVTN